MATIPTINDTMGVTIFAHCYDDAEIEVVPGGDGAELTVRMGRQRQTVTLFLTQKLAARIGLQLSHLMLPELRDAVEIGTEVEGD